MKWQKSDWCNTPRLYGKQAHKFLSAHETQPWTSFATCSHRDDLATREEAANASGFMILHQVAFNNASSDFVDMLVDHGA